MSVQEVMNLANNFISTIFAWTYAKTGELFYSSINTEPKAVDDAWVDNS